MEIVLLGDHRGVVGRRARHERCGVALRGPSGTRAAAARGGAFRGRRPSPNPRAASPAPWRPSRCAEPVAVGEARVHAPWPPAACRRVRGVAAHRFRPSPRERPATVGRRYAARHVDDGRRRVSRRGRAPSASSGGVSAASRSPAVLLFVVAVGGGYWTVFGEPADGGRRRRAPPSGSPLELVSLRHERRGATAGRRPAWCAIRSAGGPLDTLTAVVFLFDQQGGFLTSARADVDYATLVPGDESPFVIAMDAPASVARYRVSFRTDAGVVPHIDRRGQEPSPRTRSTAGDGRPGDVASRRRGQP